MSCLDLRERMVLAHYGDLEPAAARAWQKHVAGCSGCAAAAGQLRRILAALTPSTVFPREAEVDWDLPLTCRGVRAELSASPAARMDEVLEHLGRCRDCADEAAAIEATLDAVRPAFAGEDRVDWEAFARETARKARQGEADNIVVGPWRRVLRRSLPAAAAAAGLTLAYLAIRPEPPAAPTQPMVAVGTGAADSPAPVDGSESPASRVAGELLRRTRVEMAKSEAARYLADSRNVLVSFTELPVPCEGDSVDVSVERELSGRLLRRKQLLQRDLDDVEVARARRLADEVGSLLEEIALLEKCVSPRQVEEIRDLVGRRQLMMRIQMLTDELGVGGSGRA